MANLEWDETINMDLKKIVNFTKISIAKLFRKCQKCRKASISIEVYSKLSTKNRSTTRNTERNSERKVIKKMTRIKIDKQKK